MRLFTKLERSYGQGLFKCMNDSLFVLHLYYMRIVRDVIYKCIANYLWLSTMYVEGGSKTVNIEPLNETHESFRNRLCDMIRH